MWPWRHVWRPDPRTFPMSGIDQVCNTIATEGGIRVSGGQRRRAEFHKQSTVTAQRPLVVNLDIDRGRPALLVDGVVQSVAPEAAAGGYWEAMLPEHAPRSALLLGYGGGTLARLLAERWPSVRIVGVDNDPPVLALGRHAFGPLPCNIELVLADALTFVLGCTARFDYVAIDLFRGERVPRGAYGRPFLRGVRHALRPHGRAAFNLFDDERAETRTERLRTAFHVERVVRAGDNRIVHCRA
jgi:spermidine synthase